MGNIDLSNKNLTKLPKNLPKKVNNFYCSHNLLTNLKGCPEIVTGGFYCNNNILTTLENGPKEVGEFVCFENSNLLLYEIIKYILKTDNNGRIFSNYDDYLLNKINKNKNDYREIIRIIFK
jgi:hypothetical protein